MKFVFSGLALALLGLSGCTYNVTQQQNGSPKNSQLALVGGGEHGVSAYQGPEAHPFPLPTYPPGGSYYGYDGGPVGPAYPPDPAGIPYPLPIPNRSVRAY